MIGGIPIESVEKLEKVRDYDDGYYSNSNYNDSLGVDTLVGVASGAILGSQIGKGNGRVAAQIVGGLLGAKVAHEIRNNYKPSSRYNDNYRDDRYVTTTECYNTYDKVKEKLSLDIKTILFIMELNTLKLLTDQLEK